MGLTEDQVRVIFACLVLIALVVIGAVAVLFVRRRLTSRLDSTGGGFTLGDLRELHRTGKMSTEEFEKARKTIVDAARRNIAQSDSKRKPTGGGR